MSVPNLGAQDATVSGQAQRISAAEKLALQAQPAVMTAKIQITRAATGKVEEYDLTFTPLPDEQKEA